MSNGKVTYFTTKPDFNRPRVISFTDTSAGIEPPYMTHYVRRVKIPLPEDHTVEDDIKEMRSFRPNEDPMGMTTREAKKAGLFMCLVLRHNPAAAHVKADAEGWVDLEGMVRGSRGRLTRELVMEIVATNNKQRFAISEDGKKIRAKQGHSFPVDLKLEPTTPPDVLYHGTYPGAIQAILRDGLKKMTRHHVHMAAETGTAVSVGMRKGAPIVFRIDAKAMHAMGHKFFQSENGVWLVEHVPPEYLKRLPNDDTNIDRR